tara:strand:+ start:324 stop:971 length:648 start_codon:yes stop_codon:yes gene_type:complete
MDSINKYIQEDYEHFNIDISSTKSKLKYQERNLKINKLSFVELFESIKSKDYTSSIYDRSIYLTQDILDAFIKDDNIVDIEKYRIILFINSIKGGDADEEYELIDEETDEPKFNKFKSYKKIFDDYFDKRYKEKTIIDNEYIMSRLHIFNYHYDKIYPHEFNKKDNPVEYNKVSKNKSNLKTQYKKYLEGEDINTLKNIPALKMMIYIIQNTPTN